MTQVDFANACGVKPPTQFLYEKGDRYPNAEYLIKAAALGVDITLLFYGEIESLTGKLPPPSVMAHLYIECDELSRDEQGRLLDLEERVKIFKDLYVRKVAEAEAPAAPTKQRVKKV